MLKIFVVDRSADSRNRIIESINSFLHSEAAEKELLPRINVKPVSLQELKFHSSPDLLIVGEELVSFDLTQLGEVRKLAPHAPIIVRIDDTLNHISTIEQLARFGADDVMPTYISAQEFLRKVVLLSRRNKVQKTGKLIVVDAAKGGVGVTTIAAGLADALIAEGKKVALLDLDFDTQDLSRFLQAKPFVNENLQLLLDKQRPVTQEFVEHCLVRVWQDSELYCMPPIADCEQIYDLRSGYSRNFLSIIEILDSEFDCVVVDAACARGAWAKALYLTADKVVLVVNNDPATLYASVDKITKIRAAAPAVEVVVVENASLKNGLPSKLLRREFNRAAKLNEGVWAESLPYCKQGSRWPGSGSTVLSQAKESLNSGFLSLLEKLGLREPRLHAQANSLFSWLKFKRGAAQSDGAAAEHAIQLANNYNQPAALPNQPVRRELPAPALKSGAGNVVGLSTNQDAVSNLAGESEEFDVEDLVSGAKVA